MDWSTLKLEPGIDAPLYLQLCTRLTDCISSGSLLPGDQLPSERKLADLLAVSRTTAINAYKELEAKGLVRSYIGRGTFVSGQPESFGAHFAWRGKVNPAVQKHLDMGIRSLLSPAKASDISFACGVPALDYFPKQAYLEATEQVLSTQLRDAFGLVPTEGHPYLRNLIAKREGVKAEEVLIVAGTQQALDLIARCLIYPGDKVVMDWPGFLGAIQTFRLAGASLLGWDVLNTDIDELEDLFLKQRPKLLYVNPSFQNPTGRTLSLETRKSIVELARKYRLPIVEDDVYRELYFDDPPPPSLRELEGDGLVIHLRTFAKTFAVGMRLGYVIADESIIDQLAFVKAQSDLFCPGLSQLVLADLLTKGIFDSYLKVLRQKHKERAAVMQNALSTYLPELSWRAPHGGLYLWGQLQTGYSRDLLQEATKQGVNFGAGENFFYDHSGKRALRLCYSGTKPEDIKEGIKRLAYAFEMLT